MAPPKLRYLLSQISAIALQGYKNTNLTLEMLDSRIDSVARIQIDTFFIIIGQESDTIF